MDKETRSPVMMRVMERVMRDVDMGIFHGPWTPFTEEWYWWKLIEVKPFRSCYASAGHPQPLIALPEVNLSQTPREQCELAGLVWEGLDRPGPGQEVELHGLQAAAHLNGCRGRVLPLTGPGAPTTSKPTAGRLAVRLKGGEVVAARPENLRTPAIPAVAPPPPPSGPLAGLIRADVRRGQHPPLLRRSDVLQAGRADRDIMCVSCGGVDATEFVALKRTLPPSSKPVPEAVRLQCVDCLARTAAAMRVQPNAAAVEAFVDDRTMGVMEACLVMMGTPTSFSSGLFGSSTTY